MTQDECPWEANWEVGKVLGAGGQGTARLAIRKGNSSERAAIKTLIWHEDPKSRARMNREVHNMISLRPAMTEAYEKCPVPDVLDHNTDRFDNPAVYLFVAMEFVEGDTLDKIVSPDKPLPLDTATKITLRLCDIVAIAHKEDVLHRDLKPENIIVRDVSSEDVVVLDFGLSFSKANPSVTTVSETMRNNFLTLPEMITPNGDQRDRRSDVIAICALYYYLLTGHRPGQPEDSTRKLPHRRPGFLLPHQLGAANTVADLDSLFDRGLTPVISDRFQTVEELRERIEFATSPNSSEAPIDPLEVIRREAGELSRSNRPFQLNQFVEPGTKVMLSLHKFATTFKQTLKKEQPEFVLQATAKRQLVDELPVGFDPVQSLQIELRLSVASHQHQRFAIYRVASQGAQCAVLRQRFSGTSGSRGHQPLGEYKTLFWYEGLTPTDDTMRQVEESFNEWLATEVSELSALLRKS